MLNRRQRKIIGTLVVMCVGLITGYNEATSDKMPAHKGEGAYTGRVVRVLDGDTIEVIPSAGTESAPRRIRLAEIDAPEKRQPLGSAAKQALATMIFAKEIEIRPVSQDRYGRTVGNLYYHDAWVNGAMVETGYAWVYRQYSSSHQLDQWESDAKSQKKGIWALPREQRIEPWVWRKAQKSTH